jgi:hypothetical protein
MAAAGVATSVPAEAPSADVPSTPALSPVQSRPTVTPLAPERYQVTFTASAETCALLREAKQRLSHSVPDGNTDAVVNRALKALLARLDGAQNGATDRLRPARGTAPRSRHIPAHVRRAVWRRDGGRCAFIARNGHRCGAREFIQYHHVDPQALGGEATVEQIELRCRSHNNYDATLWGFRRPTRSGTSSRTPPAPSPPTPT